MFKFLLSNCSFPILISLFYILVKTYFYTKSLILNNLQAAKQLIYRITCSLVRYYIRRKGEICIQFLFYLHLILLWCNLSGMIPFSFIFTIHNALKFGLTISILIFITIISIEVQGLKLFYIFSPWEVPLLFIPFVIRIEFVYYTIKNFPFSIHLFQKMTLGHNLLIIIAGLDELRLQLVIYWLFHII